MSGRRVPGPVVVVGLALFAAAMLAFAWYRREVALRFAGDLALVRPYAPDHAIAVRRFTQAQGDGAWLLRIDRKGGSRWHVALPTEPSALALGDDRVAVTLPGGARAAYALEDGAEVSPEPVPAPQPAPGPTADCPPDVAAALGGEPRACARVGDALLAEVTGPDGAARLVWRRGADEGWRRDAGDAGPFTLVAFGGDLYAQGTRGLLLRVEPTTGEIAAAARAPGGAELGYPLSHALFVEDRLWLHDDAVIVTLDRARLRTLVGLDRIRAVDVRPELDALLPPVE